MGLIGCGRIGKAVAALAKAFDRRIIFYDTFAPADENAEKAPLETLFRQSDVISLHCPLFPENTGIINAGAIDGMKPGVLILNTARGPVINEAELAQALEEGKVGGAAVDVLSQDVWPNALVLYCPVITAGKYAHRNSFIRLTGSDDVKSHECLSLEKLVTLDGIPGGMKLCRYKTLFCLLPRWRNRA